MNKKILFAGLLLIAGLSALSPYWLGQQAEQRFNTQLAQLQQSGLLPPGTSLTVDSYERQWRSATAQTRLLIDLDRLDPPHASKNAARRLEIVMDHRIEHGPLISGTEVALARIESTLHIPEQYQETMRFYFGERQPYRQTTILAFDGKIDMRYEIPPYRGPSQDGQSTIDWQGMTGSTRGRWDSLASLSEIEAPRLLITSRKKGLLDFKGLHLSSDTRDIRAGMILGTLRLALDEFSIRDNGHKGTKQGLTSKNFTLALQSGIEDGLFRISEQISLDGIDIGDQHYGPGRLRLEFSNLDMVTLTALQEKKMALHASAASSEEKQSAALNAYLAAIGKLLSHNPVLTISDTSLQTPAGKISSSLRLAFESGTTFNADTPPATWLRYLNAQLTLSIPVDYSRQLALGKTREQLTALNPDLKDTELEQRARSQAEQLLQHFEAKHLIRREGDRHHLEASFHHGRLFINGAPAQGLQNAMTM